MKNIAKYGVIVAAALLLGACGSAKQDDATTATSTTVSSAKSTLPEQLVAPMGEVKTKLPALIKLGNEAAAQAKAGDWNAANTSYESLTNLWYEVEGAVGDSDRNIYASSEASQAMIGDGIKNKNATTVASGATGQATQLQNFLNTYAK